MKKIFSILALCAGLLLASCTNSNNGVGFLYDVDLTGDADGVVNVQFPNGNLDLNGDADLAFTYSNDTALSTGYVLTGTNFTGKQLEAYNQVNDWVDSQFNAAAASGTYYVNVKGYVKETLTGFTFSIDRTFTNRSDSTLVD